MEWAGAVYQQASRSTKIFINARDNVGLSSAGEYRDIYDATAIRENEKIDIARYLAATFD